MNENIDGCFKHEELKPGELNQGELNPEELNQDALFCSETEDYRIPEEPEANQDVLLYFRTARDDADQVIYRECGSDIEGIMKKSSRDTWFDYYEFKITTKEEPVFYYFEIKKGKKSWTYNRLGVSKETIPCFAFRITPGFHTPDWAKGAIMYQIYVDRFCNGDPTNDVETGEYIYIGVPVRGVKDWEKPLETMDVGYFYGGDLQGIWDKLNYIQSLGVEVIYLNPVFVSPSNHKYDCQDYEHIDPHYGVILHDGGEVLAEKDLSLKDEAALREENKHATKYIARVTNKENLEASDAFFARLVEEIHRRGMKIILDGVFNHCGSFNKWLDREGIYEHAEGYEPGAYVSADSPYYSFFKFYKEDKENWPYNASYDGWWGHDTLPKLCYEKSDDLLVYILSVARKWLRPPYCVDGWRLDVAADLGFSNEYNHEFWRKFRKVVKAVNPDAVIYAEHYGNPRSWLLGDQWDSVMNYDAFMEPLTWYLTGMEKHSDEFRPDMLNNKHAFISGLMHNMTKFYMPSLHIAMNQLSNHDHSRFLTRTNHRVGRVGELGSQAANTDVVPSIMREAVVFQMTWPGAPTLYYGDEAGVCGFTDPDNRRTYPWGREDQQMLQFHKDMIRIHKENPVCREGSCKFISTCDELIAYGRFNDLEQLVIVLNNQEDSVGADVDVWEVNVPVDAVMEQLIFTWWEDYTLESVDYIVTGKSLYIEMPPHSAIVLRTKK